MSPSLQRTAAVPSTPRLLALWVPDWPVIAATLQGRGRRGALPDPALAPIAIVGGRGVHAASAPARAAGVSRGMQLRRARTLCPGLAVLTPQPQREARAFEYVMASIGSILADPAVARPGLVLSEAGGPARLMGGEEALARALVESVAQDPGVECQVGIADSLLGAVLAARDGVIVPTGGSARFLAPRPLDSLTMALTTHRDRQEVQDLIRTLDRLGVRTLGDLARLARADLVARFGPVGQRAHELACGQSWRIPRAERPAGDLDAEIVLDPPVSRTDAAAFAARSLSEALVARLVSRGLAAGRLVVECGCDNGAQLSRTWMLETTPSASELTDRVRWQLEGWLSGRSAAPPASPLTRLRLVAVELRPAGASQSGLWAAPGDEAERRAGRAAERVESLLGAGGVYVPHLVPGRDPRSRCRLLPWGQAGPVAGERSGAAQPPGRSTSGGGPGEDPQHGPWQGMLPVPSPSLVLPDPAPALLSDVCGREVGVDLQGQLEGVPAQLEIPARSGDRFGASYAPEGVVAVRSWGGPWPVDEGWWRPSGPSRRAYLQIVIEGGPPLLLVRAGRWWLEAIYL